jgi:DNA-binding MarR family transcriptional regulator
MIITEKMIRDFPYAVHPRRIDRTLEYIIARDMHRHRAQEVCPVHELQELTPVHRYILTALSACHPASMTAHDLAEMFSIHESTAYANVRQLLRAEMVTITVHHQPKRYAITSAGIDAIGVDG